jgi:hypothetical protein
MKKYLHSIGIIGYGFTQWLLFAKITALAGLEAAGNYSIAQAVSGPVFGFFLFSIRSLWVAGFIDKVNYRSLYLLRIITMIVALIISVGLMQLFKEWSSVIIAVVFAIKFSEGISDIVYAKYERVGEGYIAASLLILKSVGLILLLCFCIYLDVTLDWICVLFILALFVFLLNDIYHGGGFSCVELNFYKKIKWPDKQELSQMIVLSCNSLFISLVGFLPRYALDFYSTRTIVGYYAVLMLPLTIILMAVTGYMQSNLQYISDGIKHRSCNKVWKSIFLNFVNFLLLFYILFIVIYYVFELPLMNKYLVNFKFIDIAKILILGLVACFAQYLSYIVIAVGRPSMIFKLTLISLTVQLSIILLMRNSYSFDDAIIMQFIGFLIQIIGYLHMIKKFLK